MRRPGTGSQWRRHGGVEGVGDAPRRRQAESQVSMLAVSLRPRSPFGCRAVLRMAVFMAVSQPIAALRMQARPSGVSRSFGFTLELVAFGQGRRPYRLNAFETRTRRCVWDCLRRGWWSALAQLLEFLVEGAVKGAALIAPLPARRASHTRCEQSLCLNSSLTPSTGAA